MRKQFDSANLNSPIHSEKSPNTLATQSANKRGKKGREEVLLSMLVCGRRGGEG